MTSRWMHRPPVLVLAGIFLFHLPASGLVPEFVPEVLQERPQEFPIFMDVAGEAGVTVVNVSGGSSKDYILEVNGNGAAFFDYDNDGDIDIAVTNGSTIEALDEGGHPMAVLYRNDGGRFSDVTGEAGLDRAGWAMGACAADYDNDGLSDLYLTAYTTNVLYRNLGDGRFEDVTGTAGVGETRWSSNCAFSDYDRDGDVDLYVANYVAFDPETIPRAGESDVCTYLGVEVFCGPRGLTGAPDRLYRNEGDGTFSDVTARAGLDLEGANGFGVVFSDFDNDGWSDIYVANDMMPNLLYHNNQDGTFDEVGLFSGTALNAEGREQAGMGIGAADYDGDGLPDIFVTNFSRDTNTLYRNLGEMFFADATDSAGLGGISLDHVGWGTGLADLDNDGWADVFVVNGHVYPRIDQLDTGRGYAQPKEVYRGRGDGTFEVVSGRVDDLGVPHSSRGAAFGDYDNDGDIDVLVLNMGEPPSLYRNDGGDRNHWIRFRLEGTTSNRDAIGARVEVTSGGRTQVGEVQSGGSYLSHNDMRVHFGLGTEESIERLRIRWPSGEVEEFPPMTADRDVRIREGDGLAQEP